MKGSTAQSGKYTFHFQKHDLSTLTSLSTTGVVLIRFISRSNHCYWKLKCLNSKVCECLVSNKINMSNFHQLEIVGGGSGTQLEVFFALMLDQRRKRWTNIKTALVRTMPRLTQ